MTIENVNGNGVTYFRALVNGEEVGHADYYLTPEGNYAITHLEVKPEYRGQNYGDEFVRCIVQFARDNGIRIRPLCGYVKLVFERRPGIRDVL